MSKGSSRRPASVSERELEERWARAFGPVHTPRDSGLPAPANPPEVLRSPDISPDSEGVGSCKLVSRNSLGVF